MHARLAQMHAAHVRRRADDLRIILRLRPNQEPALQALLHVERPSAPMGEGLNAPGAPPQTTPQRLDEMARRQADRAQARGRRVAALKAFYAVLDPDQQRVFDAVQRLQHGGPDGARPGPHGPMGPGGPDAGRSED